MTTDQQSRASSFNAISGEIADTELDTVSAGDKATTTKPTTTKTTTIKPIVFTLEQVLVSSY